jgi:hypothetical protein
LDGGGEETDTETDPLLCDVHTCTKFQFGLAYNVSVSVPVRLAYNGKWKEVEMRDTMFVPFFFGWRG